MKRTFTFKEIIIMLILSAIITFLLAGCGSSSSGQDQDADSPSESEAVAADEDAEEEKAEAEAESETVSGTADSDASTDESAISSDYQEIITTANVTSDGAIDASSLFTERDLRQNVDTESATYYTLSDGDEISLTEEGVYVFSGKASNASIVVDADSQAKVQIVLDGVEIENESTPCIYVKNADKVFVTTTGTDNSLTVSGEFQADGETNTDAVIYSRDDLVLNGIGTLTVISPDNGITSKDDLKITGGTLNISCVSDGLEANDSVAIAGGTMNIASYKDGIHAENDEDDSMGYVYICGGEVNIQAVDDGIHGTTIAQMDGGTINISAAEGIEATWVQINDGEINISATDDGINASYKSGAYSCLAEFNGGYITVLMGQGDTDAIDSNGDLYVNGGTLDISAQSPFDYDGYAEYNGGTIIVNGEETDAITNQFMGGGMGGPGGFGGNQRP